MRISYSNDGNALSSKPVCTVTQHATGQRNTLSRVYEHIVTDVTTSQLDIVLVHRQYVASTNTWLQECEHGDSLTIHCVEV